MDDEVLSNADIGVARRGTEAEWPCREVRGGPEGGVNVSSSRWCLEDERGRPRVVNGGVGVGAMVDVRGEMIRSEEGESVAG